MNVKFLLVLGIAMLTAAPALASGPEYANSEHNWNCGNQSLSFDTQLAQCNKAITEAQVDGGKVPVDLMESRGIVYLQKGDYDNAIADLDRVIAFKPDYPAYMDRGIARRNKNQCDLAVQDFTLALTLE